MIVLLVAHRDSPDRSARGLCALVHLRREAVCHSMSIHAACLFAEYVWPAVYQHIGLAMQGLHLDHRCTVGLSRPARIPGAARGGGHGYLKDSHRIHTR